VVSFSQASQHFLDKASDIEALLDDLSSEARQTPNMDDYSNPDLQQGLLKCDDEQHLSEELSRMELIS